MGMYCRYLVINVSIVQTEMVFGIINVITDHPEGNINFWTQYHGSQPYVSCQS